jgi:hypothetical protein
MKRALVPLSIALAAALGLGGCSMFHQHMPAPVAPPAPVAAPAAGPAVETIPFRTGVSSATVEKMARQQGCTGGLGAGLITQPGPVEVYRMRCEDGKVFMARCELRQCKQM